MCPWEDAENEPHIRDELDELEETTAPGPENASDTEPAMPKPGNNAMEVRPANLNLTCTHRAHVRPVATLAPSARDVAACRLPGRWS